MESEKYLKLGHEFLNRKKALREKFVFIENAKSTEDLIANLKKHEELNIESWKLTKEETEKNYVIYLEKGLVGRGTALHSYVRNSLMFGFETNTVIMKEILKNKYLKKVFDDMSKKSESVKETREEIKKIIENKKHGGARKGAGRPKKEPTKQMRLNEEEQKLINDFRESKKYLIEYEKQGESWFLTCKYSGDCCEYFFDVDYLQWISPYTNEVMQKSCINTVEEAKEVFKRWIIKERNNS